VEFLFTGLCFFCCLYLIFRFSFFRLEGIPAFWISGAFILKVLAGIFFWYIYTYYYTVRSEADIYKFFDDGKILYSALREHPGDFVRIMIGLDSDPHFYQQYFSRMQVWSPRFENSFNFENRNMVRLSALLRIFSAGFYQVQNVWMNLFSFSGLVALYRSFGSYTREKSKLLFAGIFLCPSVLFWGSAVIKESFILFALGFSIYFLHQLISKENRDSVLKAVIFLLFLAAFKAALALFVAAGFTAWYLSLRIRIWFSAVNFVLVFALLFTAAVMSARLGYYAVFKTLAVKQENLLNIAKGGVYLKDDHKLIYIDYTLKDQILVPGRDSLFGLRKGSSYYYIELPRRSDTVFVSNSTDTSLYPVFSRALPVRQSIQITRLDSNPASFIKAAPKAFFNALLRPFPWEAKNLISLLMSLQNLTLTLLFIPAIWYSKKSIFNTPAFWFCLFTMGAFYLLFGWITPVLGALMRYKTSVFPLLMIVLILLYEGPFLRDNKRDNKSDR